MTNILYDTAAFLKQEGKLYLGVKRTLLLKPCKQLSSHESHVIQVSS